MGQPVRVRVPAFAYCCSKVTYGYLRPHSRDCGEAGCSGNGSSGILRMADLLALQPDMDIKLHIVAPAGRREKVFQELLRPVFSLSIRRAVEAMHLPLL